MTTLVSRANGDFSASATWRRAATGTGCEQTSDANSTAVTSTSYQWSPAFTITSGEVIEGLVLQLGRRADSGTITIGLSDDGGAAAAREVQLNCGELADVNAGGSCTPTFVFVKFASPITADGGSDFKIGVKVSSSGNAQVYRSSVAADWWRVLVTDISQAPGAGDNLIVVGEYTGPATYTSINVTMDSTSSTDYGWLRIGARGSVRYGTAVGTNYLLKVSGHVWVGHYGELSLGTTGIPMPPSSSAELLIDCASAAQYYLYHTGGAINGVSAETRVSWTTLSADVAVGGTVLTVADTTGWQAGDTLLVTGTRRSTTESELRAISTVDSATQVTLDSGVTYPHDGGGTYTKGEVANLSRNVRIRAPSASLAFSYSAGTYGAGAGNVSVLNLSRAAIQYCCQFLAPASSSIAYYPSAKWEATLDRCAFLGAGGVTYPYALSMSVTRGAITFSDNVWYLPTGMNWLCKPYGADAVTVTGNLLCGPGNIDDGKGVGQVGDGVNGADWTTNRITFDGNVITGDTTSLGFQLGSGVTADANKAHANAGGFNLRPPRLNGTPSPFNECRVTNLRSYRNTGVGLTVTPWTAGWNIGVDGGSSFENGTAGVDIQSGLPLDVRIANLEVFGSAAHAQPYGVRFGGTTGCGCPGLVFDGLDCHDHATADVVLSQAAIPSGYAFAALFDRCILASTTPVSIDTGRMTYDDRCAIRFQCYNDADGSHRWYAKYHTGITDESIYADSAPSVRLTPSHASFVNRSPRFKVAVAAGQVCTASVKVRESMIGDGTDYNGARVQLCVKRNHAAGITDDIVLDTATAASEGAWETLSGTTPAVADDCVLEFYATFSGTAGWVNVDDWDAANSDDTRGMGFWIGGEPWAVAAGEGGGFGGISRSRVQGVM